jgi:two-component system LytT family sensor kinase
MQLKSSFTLFMFFLHLVFWIAFYMVPFIDPRGVHPVSRLNAGFFFDFHLLTNHLFFIFLFYFNSNYLIPQILRKGEKWKYTIIIIILFLSILLFSYLLFPFIRLPHEHFLKKPPRLPSREVMRMNQTIALSIPLLFVLMVSVTYRLLLDKFLHDKKAKEKETEHLKTELSFLRSQISPHFIFNALNSSIILVRKKSELAEDSLLKLASLLRYMLYESDVDKVNIQNEVQYISDYIDLQCIRFGSTIKIRKEIVVDELIEGSIEPMLLIPFVENAFKHGTSIISSPEIYVSIITEGNKLIVEVKNRFKQKEGVDLNNDKNHGIGLVNVKRRLELLYPNTHQLTISDDNDWYSVYLSLDIIE